jgi:hypothetical protein
MESLPITINTSFIKESRHRTYMKHLAVRDRNIMLGLVLELHMVHVIPYYINHYEDVDVDVHNSLTTIQEHTI